MHSISIALLYAAAIAIYLIWPKSSYGQGNRLLKIYSLKSQLRIVFGGTIWLRRRQKSLD